MLSEHFIWISRGDKINSKFFCDRGILAGSAKNITLIGSYRLNSTSIDTAGINNGVLLHFTLDNGQACLQIVSTYDCNTIKIRTGWYETWRDWVDIV